MTATLGLEGCGTSESGDLGSGGSASDGLGSGGLPTGGTPGGGGTAASDGGRSADGGATGSAGGPSSGGRNAGGDTGQGGNGPGLGGSQSVGGSGNDGTCGGERLPEPSTFDCGPKGQVFAASGRADNRVNYVIVGDGYDESQADELFLEHVENMLNDERAGFYSAIAEPYGRYRNFINICALKLASADSCIDNPDIDRECDTLFDGRCEPPCGTSGTRLGVVNRTKVNAALAAELPSGVDVDWSAVTLNADANGWWNSGGPVMVWNGGYQDSMAAASVAIHEGGHTFHGLADEYGGTSQDCGEFQELNSTADPEAEKWAHWLGYDDRRDDTRPLPPGLSTRPYGTFVQGAYEGSRYCDRGQYRPSRDSQMNQLPQPFNMPSVEKIILDIYDIVEPIDAHTDNSAPLSAPVGLEVRLVDAEVSKVEWSVDGEVASGQTGTCFLLPELSAGEHEVTVRVYDDTPWVRRNRELLEQTVSWRVVMP